VAVEVANSLTFVIDATWHSSRITDAYPSGALATCTVWHQIIITMKHNEQTGWHNAFIRIAIPKLCQI